MARTLQLEFMNELKKSFTITLDEPREGLTSADVTPVMTDILARNIFKTPGGKLVDIVGARIISKDVEELVIV